MFAVVEEMQVESGESLLEQGGSGCRGAAILFAVEHKQRRRQLVQPLPDRDIFFTAAAPRRFCSLQESLKIFAHAHPMAFFQNFGGDQRMIEEILLQ